MSIDSLSFTLVDTHEDMAEVCDVRTIGDRHRAPSLRCLL